MKTLQSLTLALLTLTLFSCSGGGSQKDDSGSESGGSEKMQEVKVLQKEVIKVHDEVMPKMEKLQDLKGRAKTLRDSLREVGDSSLAARMDRTVVRLEEGHKSMMDWMRNFDKPYKPKLDTLEAADPAAALEYLEGQKKEVKAMRDTFMNAMKGAQKRLDSLEN